MLIQNPICTLYTYMYLLLRNLQQYNTCIVMYVYYGSLLGMYIYTCRCMYILFPPPQHQYEEVNNAVIQGCIKTLAISVRTLTQLVVNFCQSYEAELQPWVGHRMPPALGPLGMVGKRTTTHWSHISKVPTHTHCVYTLCRYMYIIYSIYIHVHVHRRFICVF